MVKLIALGWEYKPEYHDKYLLGVQLTRIMFPYLLFIGARRACHGHAELAPVVPDAGAVAGHAEHHDDQRPWS